MSTSSVHIRAAVASDTQALCSLLTELNLLEGYDRSASPEELADILFHEEARRVHMRALVAVQAETPVGMVLYYWGYDTVSASMGYHLADIVVTKKQRGKSIGQRLYKALAAQCLHEGGQWISLTVLSRNAAAKKFYASVGMVEVDVDFYAIGPVALERISTRSF